MPDPSIFTNAINSFLPEPQASLLNGMLFGSQISTTTEFYDQLKAVGLLHLVVLSGMNITLLGATVGAILAPLGRRASTLITIPIIILFIAFVGVEAPIIRAGIMGILTLVSLLYGLRASALYLLIVTSLIMVVIWPEWLGSISFQLSFGATLGIILFGPKIDFGQKGVDQKIVGLKREFRTAISAMIFTAPLIFYYFGEISLISPVANVLVSPLVAPIMVFGFILSIILVTIPAIAMLPGLVTYGMLSYIVIVVEKLSSLPFVHVVI